MINRHLICGTAVEKILYFSHITARSGAGSGSYKFKYFWTLTSPYTNLRGAGSK